MSATRPFVVGERVEAALEDDLTAFYPGLISKVREKGRYDVQFDDNDVGNNLKAQHIRWPAWWWVDEGEPGLSPRTRCHLQVRYTDAEGKLAHLKSGDLVVLKNNVSKKKSVAKHHERGNGLFVAEVLCFFEEYHEEHVEAQRLRARRYPCARFVLDTDKERAHNGSFPVLYPCMEVRFFYFPELVFKDKSACQPFLPGEIFETDDVAAGCHLNDVLGHARVMPDREAFLNNRATQETQTQAETQSDGWFGEDSHFYLCQHFYDIQAKRLRGIAFNPNDAARGRKFSRHLFQADTTFPQAPPSRAVGGSDSGGGSSSRSSSSSSSTDADSTGSGGNDGRRASDAAAYDDGDDGDATAGGARKRPRGLQQHSLARAGGSAAGQQQQQQPERDLFMLAYNELQLSAVPHSLPCRQAERQKIYSYLRNAIATGGQQSTLYVSGLPGTGKTATLMEVVRMLGQDVQTKGLPSFKFVMLNAMELSQPQHAYRDILFKITGEVKTAAKAADALRQVFLDDDPTRPATLLVVDEIDCLSTRKQEVLCVRNAAPRQRGFFFAVPLRACLSSCTRARSAIATAIAQCLK